MCEKHFSGFIEALGSKGILCTLKKVLRQPHNVLMMQILLSLCDFATLQIYLARSIGH